MDFEKFAETTAFKQVAQTITALSTQDERIAEEFRAIEQGRISKGTIVEIEGDIPIGMKIELGDFAAAISTRLWGAVGRANWRPFAEAREFVRGLGLKSHIEWWQWTTGRFRRADLPNLPADIPAGPEQVYTEEWKDWADWLGHSRRIGGWRKFSDARRYARSLNLGSRKQWAELTSDRARKRMPDDIPSEPSNVYSEWIGWWDWLGTANRRGRWLSFTKARTLARRLRLTSEAEFIRWRRGLLKHKIKCPIDMPMHPDRVYSEFVSWPDFLGFTPASFLPFEQAREFVRRQKLKSQLEYREWSTGRLSRRGLQPKPSNIPANPDQLYDDEWRGFNDFIGTPKRRGRDHKWRPFEQARSYVRSLKLSNYIEYRQWSKGKLKNKPIFPNDIPMEPYGIYGREEGWKGLPDFLGSKASPKYVEMWPFDRSRAFVQKLKFQSSTEYFRWAGEGLRGVSPKPPEIPVVPRSKYRKQWRGWDDWLGRNS